VLCSDRAAPKLCRFHGGEASEGTVEGGRHQCRRVGIDRLELGGATAIAIDIGLQSYLKQINHAPLLTPEQEKELATTLREGREAADRFAAREMTLAQRETAEKAAAEARERMVKSNLRLVVNIAKKYVRRNTLLNDLINEGNLGLIRAVEGFDPDQNTRFSTYASWWIKQAIKRSLINGDKPVHIPAYMVEMISRFRRTRQRFLEDEGRSPTIEELSELLEMPQNKVNHIRSAVRAVSSTTQLGDGDDGASLADGLADERAVAPDEAMLNEAELSKIAELLTYLDERESKILRLRYGFENGEMLTLKEIGIRVGLTRERVRQIERQAIAKLKGCIEQ